MVLHRGRLSLLRRATGGRVCRREVKAASRQGDGDGDQGEEQARLVALELAQAVGLELRVSRTVCVS